MLKFSGGCRGNKVLLFCLLITLVVGYARSFHWTEAPNCANSSHRIENNTFSFLRKRKKKLKSYADFFMIQLKLQSGKHQHIEPIFKLRILKLNRPAHHESYCGLVDRAPTRCLGGHQFDFHRDSDFSLFHAYGMINSSSPSFHYRA